MAVGSEIKVGVTEWHGAIHEAAQCPPRGVTYVDASELEKGKLWPIRSPIKKFLRKIDSTGVDVVEAIISPVLTKGVWVYSLGHYAEALAFSIYGVPIPRKVRAQFVRNILAKENCKKILFWSNAGLRTLSDYGREVDGVLINKSAVVYPAVREPETLRYILEKRKRGDKQGISLLFQGDFFRKGGAHVIDAFERIQSIVPRIKLRLCCDEKIDFNTADAELRAKYLNRIKNNSGVKFGRVSRQEMIQEVLPNADIYLLPTYVEVFGFGILEAMAHAIPVVSTNYFAIPEMVTEGANGLLIDTSAWNCDALFRGYFVKRIPQEFHEFMSESVFQKIMNLVESYRLRLEMGEAGIEVCRSKFSIERRNMLMSEIYDHAVAKA